jgi:hypothetical protein
MFESKKAQEETPSEAIPEAEAVSAAETEVVDTACICPDGRKGTLFDSVCIPNHI